MVDIKQLQIFRGEVLKELHKYQGDNVRIGVIKKAFSPLEGMPLSKIRSVFNYLQDKKYIQWEIKDEIEGNDDLIRITAYGQDVVDRIKEDTGIIVLD